MCFSATASFVTAGATALVGTVTLARVRAPHEIPLAATPLLFALQQIAEGLLWLHLPLAPDDAVTARLTLVFLIFAEVFWPAYVPLAVWLVEPSAARRRLMLVCLAVGTGIGCYLLWWILKLPLGAAIVGGHIVYQRDYWQSDLLGLAYLAATGLPLLLSSQRTVVALGAIILVGATVAYVFYWEAFVSVWCFFAAAASVMIFFHFERSRRRLLAASA